MNKPYHAEITTDHLFDSELTGIQKLLATLLIVDRSLDIYDLSCLAKISTDEVILALKVLKKQGYFQTL